MIELVTRDEINRLWANLSALQMLVAMDVARRWPPTEIDRWSELMAGRIDAASTSDELARANWARAIDALALDLRKAVPRPPARPA